jgi:G3E family GTPase
VHTRLQVAFADVILINKVDLVDEAALVALTKRLQGINAFAKVHRMQLGVVPLERVMGLRGKQRAPPLAAPDHAPPHCYTGPQQPPSPRHVTAAPCERHGVIRMIDCPLAVDQPLVAAFDLERITAIDPSFLEDEDHMHDATVSSVGISRPGMLDLQRTNAFIGTLLREQGTDIFRSKGILSIHGKAEKFVYQGVHMLFSMQPLGVWQPGEQRASKLIFIGRNLNRAELERSIDACMVA